MTVAALRPPFAYFCGKSTLTRGWSVCSTPHEHYKIRSAKRPCSREGVRGSTVRVPESRAVREGPSGTANVVSLSLRAALKRAVCPYQIGRNQAQVLSISATPSEVF